MSAQSNTSSGFIDLATFDEVEKYLYGGPDSTTYFQAAHKTSTWFTLVPAQLNKTNAAGWGADWSVSISRAGDYLRQAWLRVNISTVRGSAAPAREIRWTRNFGHNLIQSASLSFNDLSAQTFDNYFLDFWAAFTVPKSKQTGYDNMIGNTAAQYDGGGAHNIIPAFTINVPLPFFFTRDSGVALPTAALPYNEMRINIQFRDWTQLLIAYDGATPAAATITDVVVAPTMKEANIWAEYAIVSNDERKRMGCSPRDILIEQVQPAPRTAFELAVGTKETNTDIRFSHAIKTLFFGVRNTTISSEWSNYTVGAINSSGEPLSNVDPISYASLLYENTVRLALPSDYFALVEPWYKAVSIPEKTGYHMYSYSLNMYDINPMGSTNYGKLTNVSLRLTSIDLAQPAGSTYSTVIIGVNHNVCRISGGAFGFPVL